MDWTNYHHLLYFYTSVKLGGISKAAVELHVSQPTISKLIATLEIEIGEKLWEKKGRGHKLTESGEVVYQYAQEIFSLGSEMRNALKTSSQKEEKTLVIGLNQALPKLIAVRLITPLRNKHPNVKLKCVEGPLEDLLNDLMEHKLDIVLSDSAASTEIYSAFNHLLIESEVALYGKSKMVNFSQEKFPQCLSKLPLILPTYPSELRKSFDEWCQSIKLEPNVVAECDDSGLMKSFGAAGVGAFIAPVLVEKEIEAQLKTKRIASIPNLKEKIWLITGARKIIHPVVKDLIGK